MKFASIALSIGALVSACASMEPARTRPEVTIAGRSRSEVADHFAARMLDSQYRLVSSNDRQLIFEQSNWIGTWRVELATLEVASGVRVVADLSMIVQRTAFGEQRAAANQRDADRFQAAMRKWAGELSRPTESATAAAPAQQ